MQFLKEVKKTRVAWFVGVKLYSFLDQKLEEGTNFIYKMWAKQKGQRCVLCIVLRVGGVRRLLRREGQNRGEEEKERHADIHRGRGHLRPPLPPPISAPPLAVVARIANIVKPPRQTTSFCFPYFLLKFLLSDLPLCRPPPLLILLFTS